MRAPSPRDVVHDFDFHPDEEQVRVFASVDVPRLDDDAFVARGRYGDVVLHHYAWASEWFKVNLSTDASGGIVETAANEAAPAFAFNIDIATPMERADREVFAVDLFADVLVRADAVTYTVGDVEQMDAAVAAGFISSSEHAAAERALARLLELIERGRLLSKLADAWPVEAVWPPEAPQVQRVPLLAVSRLAPGMRSTW